MSYKNPIIKGFHPDPSICRVGDDYYIVTSSFEYFPGIPIFHSKDLVNWEQIGNCITRGEQLPMENAKASGGIWAPTIRYYKGIFYVTATFDGMGNFIIFADDPWGEWSDPVWVEMDGIDPSMFFENNELYYCANDCGSRSSRYVGEGISVGRIDIHTGRIIGYTVRIWTGTGGGFLEAPHIYRIGNYYYLLVSEGGTNTNHMITIARAKEILGPYESCPDNPILTNRNDTSKQIACAGHGDLVEDESGNWWLVHLGTRPVKGVSHLGRETFLMPVTWENDWPVIGEDKKSHLAVNTMLLEENRDIKKYCADLSLRGAEWIHIRNPKTEKYVFEKGQLTVYPDKVKLNTSKNSPVFIGQRQPDFDCIIDVETKWKAFQKGDYAGIALYLSDKNIYRFGIKQMEDKPVLVIEKAVDDFYQIAYQEYVESNDIHYRIVAHPEKYDFYYSLDGKEYIYACSASTRFLSCEYAIKCFTGVVWGIFAECESETDARLIINKVVVDMENKE